MTILLRLILALDVKPYFSRIFSKAFHSSTLFKNTSKASAYPNIFNGDEKNDEEIKSGVEPTVGSKCRILGVGKTRAEICTGFSVIPGSCGHANRSISSRLAKIYQIWATYASPTIFSLIVLLIITSAPRVVVKRIDSCC